MKKLIIAIMVIIVLVAVFAGCANNDRNPTYTVVPTVTARPMETARPDGVYPTAGGTDGIPGGNVKEPSLASPTAPATQ